MPKISKPTPGASQIAPVVDVTATSQQSSAEEIIRPGQLIDLSEIERQSDSSLASSLKWHVNGARDREQSRQTKMQRPIAMTCDLSATSV